MTLDTFRIIVDFVNELADRFGSNSKPLLLYRRLVSRVTVGDATGIQRHLDAFQSFCVENRERILHRHGPLGVIKFSDRIFIDIDHCLRKADADDASTIWKYLLTISAILDPLGKAKDVLTQQMRDDPLDGLLNGGLLNGVGGAEMSQVMQQMMGQLSEMGMDSIMADVLAGNPSGIAKLMTVGPQFVQEIMGNPAIQSMAEKLAQNPALQDILQKTNASQPEMMDLLHHRMNGLMETLSPIAEHEHEPDGEPDGEPDKDDATNVD